MHDGGARFFLPVLLWPRSLACFAMYTKDVFKEWKKKDVMLLLCVGLLYM
jgi:hypothetical protein